MKTSTHATYRYTATASPRPRHTARMNADEIVAWCSKNWGMSYDENGKGTPTNKTTAFMGEVATTYFDPNDWKNPFIAYGPCDPFGQDLTEWVKAAIIWYHGARGVEAGSIANSGIASIGYAC